jgi:hypothetical protein
MKWGREEQFSLPPKISKPMRSRCMGEENGMVSAESEQSNKNLWKCQSDELNGAWAYDKLTFKENGGRRQRKH